MSYDYTIFECVGKNKLETQMDKFDDQIEFDDISLFEQGNPSSDCLQRNQEIIRFCKELDPNFEDAKAYMENEEVSRSITLTALKSNHGIVIEILNSIIYVSIPYCHEGKDAKTYFKLLFLLFKRIKGSYEMAVYDAQTEKFNKLGFFALIRTLVVYEETQKTALEIMNKG